jgi:hypothetical protein
MAKLRAHLMNGLGFATSSPPGQGRPVGTPGGSLLPDSPSWADAQTVAIRVQAGRREEGRSSPTKGTDCLYRANTDHKGLCDEQPTVKRSAGLGPDDRSKLVFVRGFRRQLEQTGEPLPIRVERERTLRGKGGVEVARLRKRPSTSVAQDGGADCNSTS